MTVFRESFRLLREMYGGCGGFGGCQGKVCFVKCMAVLADVSVCNLHMLRPTSETQNCEKNKCRAQNGGFDAFEGTQCLTFLRSLMLRGAFGFGGFGGLNLGPTLGCQGGWVPQTKPVPLLVSLDPRTTSGSLSKEA